MTTRGGNSLALAMTMLGLRADRRTGVLDVQSGGIATHIYFKDGRPVFAEDGNLGETFGRLLLRQGAIDDDQFVRVIDVMTRAAGDDDQLRFGEIAVRLGFLTHEQVERGLADQARAMIGRELLRDASQWAFDTSSSLAEPPRSFSLEIDAIVLDAMRRLSDARSVENVVSARSEDFVVLMADARVLAKRFDMTSLELKFLRKIDGSRRARELLADATSPDVDVCALLATLILAGAVALLPQPAYASNTGVQDLGAEEPSSAGPPPATSSLPDRADRPVATTAPARDRVEQPRGPDAGTHKARLAAEQAFQKGMAFLRSKQVASAALELRRASELQPESLEYTLYAAWAEAHSLGEIPRESDRQKLLEIAHKAKERDPTFAFASYVLGQHAMWADDMATAKKWLYEALRLDPALDEARQQVRILARREAGASDARMQRAPVHRHETVESTQPASTEASEPSTPPEAAHVHEALSFEPEAPPVHEDHVHEAPHLPEPVSSVGGVSVHEASSPREPVSSKGRVKWLLPGVVLVTAAALAVHCESKRWPASEVAPNAAVVATSLSSEVTPPTISAVPSDTEAALVAAPPGSGTGYDAEVAVAVPPPDTSGTGLLELTGAEGLDSGSTETIGTVRLPEYASGHRVFVDGRVAGDAPTLHLPCGRHVIQIGSRGTPKPVDVPCRGEVQLQ